MWELDLSTMTWVHLNLPETPEPRSGHTSVEFGGKAYVFGGIHEITKELNELL